MNWKRIEFEYNRKVKMRKLKHFYFNRFVHEAYSAQYLPIYSNIYKKLTLYSVFKVFIPYLLTLYSLTLYDKYILNAPFIVCTIAFIVTSLLLSVPAWYHYKSVDIKNKELAKLLAHLSIDGTRCIKEAKYRYINVFNTF